MDQAPQGELSIERPVMQVVAEKDTFVEMLYRTVEDDLAQKSTIMSGNAQLIELSQSNPTYAQRLGPEIPRLFNSLQSLSRESALRSMQVPSVKQRFESGEPLPIFKRPGDGSFIDLSTRPEKTDEEITNFYEEMDDEGEIEVRTVKDLDELISLEESTLVRVFGKKNYEIWRVSTSTLPENEKASDIQQMSIEIGDLTFALRRMKDAAVVGSSVKIRKDNQGNSILHLEN